jgi:hypothetical protein
MDNKTRLKLVLIVRKEIKSKFTNWRTVEHLCEAADLSDTAFLDELRNRNKTALLKDYLLSPSYHRKMKG